MYTLCIHYMYIFIIVSNLCFIYYFVCQNIYAYFYTCAVYACITYYNIYINS